MNRMHSSEKAPHSLVPCVVAEKLAGKKRCSRAPVDEHAEL